MSTWRAAQMIGAVVVDYVFTREVGARQMVAAAPVVMFVLRA